MQISSKVGRTLAVAGVAVGLSAVFSIAAEGLAPMTYGPLLAAVLLICGPQLPFDRQKHDIAELITKIASRVDQRADRFTHVLKEWEEKLGGGGLVIVAWAFLQIVVEMVRFLAGSSAIAFAFAVLIADVVAAALAIIAACHFAIQPSGDE